MVFWFRGIWKSLVYCLSLGKRNLFSKCRHFTLLTGLLCCLSMIYIYIHYNTIIKGVIHKKDVIFNKISTSSQNSKVHEQPHILLIVTDDQGYNDVGYHGFSKIKTPVLDRLARTGLILDNYYVQPACTPTRGQLFTGRHEIHTGLDRVIQPEAAIGLPLGVPTFADQLKRVGYSTNLVGKWHLGFMTNDHLPTNRGFDSFFGILNGHAHHYTRILKSGIKTEGYDLYEGDKPADLEKYNFTYSTHMYAEKAIEIVNSHASSEPLLLVISFQAPHGPHQVPNKYKDMNMEGFNNDNLLAVHAGMVSCVDEAISNITDSFKRRGFWNNTLMIFSSDNGGRSIFERINYPLKGHKGDVLEGGIKVPAFVHSELLSDKIKGTISKELIHVSDWFPTLVKLGKGSIGVDKHIYGHDVGKTILYGDRSPRTEILHQIRPDVTPIGQSLFNDTFDTRIRAGLRMGDWKLITGICGLNRKYLQSEDSEIKNLYLYNIRLDPTESREVSSDHMDIVKAMLDRLQEYKDTMVPGFDFNKKDRRSDPQLHGGFWRPWM